MLQICKLTNYSKVVFTLWQIRSELVFLRAKNIFCALKCTSLERQSP
jgi:hypothetical protein